MVVCEHYRWRLPLRLSRQNHSGFSHHDGSRRRWVEVDLLLALVAFILCCSGYVFMVVARTGGGFAAGSLQGSGDLKSRDSWWWFWSEVRFYTYGVACDNDCIRDATMVLLKHKLLLGLFSTSLCVPIVYPFDSCSLFNCLSLVCFHLLGFIGPLFQIWVNFTLFGLIFVYNYF